MKKSILLGMALLGCSLFTFAGFYASDRGDVETVKAIQLTTAEAILTEYDLGQEFSVPKATISYEGESYEATDFRLYFPDGTPYISETVSLNALGEYTLEYQVVVGGERISANQTFKVNSSAYSIGPNSVLEYSDSLERITGSSVAGLHLELADKDIFTYNEPINIYDYDKDTPLLRMHPYSNGGKGTTHRESLKQVVRLTDCYDLENFIELELCWDYSNHIEKTAAAYYRADVAGKKSIGLLPIAGDKVVNSAIYLGATRYQVCDGVYGAFTSTWQLTDAGLTVYFDPVENCFYAEDRSKILVSDLDNAELYGKDVFKGFTTGEVYVSVLAEEYYESAVKIDVSMMAGKEERNLHLDKIYDRKAPVISLDVPTAEKIYYVARNESIKLPDATVYDVNLKGGVSVGVYSQYGTAKQRQHSCKNGIFTPKSVGLYTVVYTAKDAYGTTSTKILTLNCIDSENDQIVSFELQKATSLQAGQTCQLPACGAFSKNGNVAISAYYRLAGAAERFEIIDNEFFVENVGEYEIIYEYSDVFTSYSTSYTVSSVPTDNISFSDPILPKYLIANATYTFDKVYAYTYEAANPTPQAVEVFLIADGGSEVKVDYANVVVPDCEKVKFKYSYGGVSVYSEEVSVVNVGFGSALRMQDYFVGDFEKTADYNSVYFQSNRSGDSNSLEFVNVLSLSKFNFSFNIPAATAEGSYDNFEAVDITLTDYYDRDNTVTITYLKKPGTTNFVCGNAQADVNVSFVGNHRFSYDQRLNVFKDMSGKAVSCPTTFSSDEVLLTISLRKIDGSAKIAVNEVCGQSFTNDTFDYGAPIMLLDDDGGVKKLGDVITIKMPKVIDVLCPFSQANLTLTVSKPSKGYATSVDGIVLQTGCATDREYLLEMTEEGAYKVRFTYYDADGNSITMGFTANVSDAEAPTIQLNDGYNESTIAEAKLNTKVSIQGYVVSDNKTPTDQLTVRLMVYSPSFEHVFLADNQFNATQQGTYTVYYYVYDAVGNYSVISYKVYVS